MVKWIIIINSFLPWVLLLILIIVKDLVTKLDFKINYIIYSKKKNDIEEFKKTIDKIADKELDSDNGLSEKDLSEYKIANTIEELDSLKSKIELGEKVCLKDKEVVLIFQSQLTCLGNQELVYLGKYKILK